MDFIRCDHDTAEPIRDRDGMCILVPPGRFWLFVSLQVIVSFGNIWPGWILVFIKDLILRDRPTNERRRRESFAGDAEIPRSDDDTSSKFLALNSFKAQTSRNRLKCLGL